MAPLRFPGRALAPAVVALFALLPNPGVSQAPDSRPTVIRAARMLDVASGTMVTDAVIVVVGEVITSVNPSRLPAGVRTA